MEVRRYAVGKGEEPEALAGRRDEVPEKERSALAGQSLKSLGETGPNSPRLGGTQHNSRREDDADGSGRPKAKDGAAKMGRRAWRRLVRMHGGREMRGG